MNPTLKAELDKLDAVKSELDTLIAKDKLEEADNQRLKAILGEEGKNNGELDSITDRCKTLKMAHDRAGQTATFLDGHGGVKSVNSVPANLSSEELEALNDKNLKAQLKAQAKGGWANGSDNWLERVGTEHYGKSPAGKMIPIDGEGWAIDEKQFKKICEPTYIKAFVANMRGKADNADLKFLQEGSDGDGGWLVPPEYIARLIARKPHPTSIINRIQTLPCSRDRVVMPRINYDADTADIYTSGVRIQWIGENGPTPAIVDPVFGSVEIPIYLGQFPIEVSKSLLADTAIPIEQVINMLAGEAFNLGIDNVIVNGTGAGQPTGILTGAGGAGVYCPTVNVGNPVTANGLTGAVYGLPPQYSDSPNTCAVMNRISAFSTFAQIQDTSGQYIFGLAREQGPEGMAVARKPMLFGYDVVFSAFVPNIGSGNSVSFFGDLEQTYVLAQRVGLSVLPYGLQDKTMLGNNRVGWMFRFRMGGQVVQNRATHVLVQS